MGYGTRLYMRALTKTHDTIQSQFPLDMGTSHHSRKRLAFSGVSIIHVISFIYSPFLSPSGGEKSTRLSAHKDMDLFTSCTQQNFRLFSTQIGLLGI
jgi:hypothetical protein